MESSGEAEIQVDLPQDLHAPGTARAATRGILPGWRLTNLLEPVLLVVSELVSNAVRHGRPPVRMTLRKVGQGVRIRVHDEDSAKPEVCAPTDVAQSGRGLLIVEAVASETGVEQTDGGGKVVWAQVDVQES